MNKRGCFWLLLIALAFAVLSTLLGCFYVVHQTEQVIITQFGKPVGEPITKPGLHVKLPIVQEVNRIDKRFLEWGGAPVAIPTRDKTYIHVDTFARWRISDPTTFFVRLRDERSAQSRLEDILGSETRNAVAKHDLIEIVRTDKERKPLRDETLKNVPTGLGTIGVLPPIHYGRVKIEEEIKTKGAKKLAEFGIDLLDVRLKRVNYNPDVLDRIYQRMISERRQIAQRFRSEGEGEAARIAGQKERDLNEIQSTAYRQVQQIRGEADAKATEIYALAYTQNPNAADFYNFLKSMETYRKVMAKDATLILSTDSDLFNLLKRASAKPSNAPPVR
ncbi:MAG TPA: protease modulator HflC [Candidatus Baltobacteraceae bacterium]|nr:protease modulator HflC [Candidatus Baltobacteraceae bacterium]